ncbi:GFA family protein [Pseudomonadales bacterium]|nr:GFA family protein [Pseudomonadales bacterium]
MSDKCVKGACLCGDVAYELSGNLGIFQYCHCSRCRKFTGSAHAANLFVGLDQFKWLRDESLVGTFLPEETKYFATAFCKKCGSSLPWQSKGGKTIIVPAGTLNDDPEIAPFQNIFCGSKAHWFKSSSDLPEYQEMPQRQ